MKLLCRFALLACLGLWACDRQAATEEPRRPKKTAKAPTKGPGETPSPQVNSAEPKGYLVPFAWEASDRDPLAQTRSFMKEILTDNGIYMDHGPRFFAAFASGQKPRATVVTCADSRVHTTAFDTTPENDEFMIRNIGNQIGNSEGSVEYGVEHLETPVLMILGHTGCGAVQAVLAGISEQSAAVRKELEPLKLPEPKPGASPEAAWSAAVVTNVHNQVAFGLERFGSRVHAGKLTVVGAVYDFRNDLGQGPGRVSIVNVNGNTDPERMQAFIDAVGAGAGSAKKAAQLGGAERPSRRPPLVAATKQQALTTADSSDEAMVQALGKIPGLLVQSPGTAGR